MRQGRASTPRAWQAGRAPRGMAPDTSTSYHALPDCRLEVRLSVEDRVRRADRGTWTLNVEQVYTTVERLVRNGFMA